MLLLAISIYDAGMIVLAIMAATVLVYLLDTINAFDSKKFKARRRMKKIFNCSTIGVDKKDPSLLYWKNYDVSRLRVEQSEKSKDKFIIHFTVPTKITVEDSKALQAISTSIKTLNYEGGTKSFSLVVTKLGAAKWEDFALILLRQCFNLQNKEMQIEEKWQMGHTIYS